MGDSSSIKQGPGGPDRKEIVVRKFLLPVVLVLAFSLLAVSCGKKAEGPVTLTVWDYYGESTPLKSVAEDFMKANPNITVNIEELGWQAMNDKLDVALAGGTPPDMATVDMTWLPKLASLGALSDLDKLSGGKLNGKPISDCYSAGALNAMKYQGRTITMMYDFDVYCLYYRADLFEKKGLTPPKTWDELVEVAGKLKEGDKYRYSMQPDAFHPTQFIYENGGSLLNSDNTKAVFNSPEAVEAVQFYSDLLLKHDVAIEWTVDKGAFIQGIKDGRIGMFSDGPYMMGVLKTGAPEMSGMWKVAPHPIGKAGAGSYLGGTGLIVPEKAEHKDAAWKFIQFCFDEKEMTAPFTKAGASPALTAALEAPELSAPDSYFGGENAFACFLEAMNTAKPFPYVRSWDEISGYFGTAMEQILLGKSSVKDALDEAAAKADEALAK